MISKVRIAPVIQPCAIVGVAALNARVEFTWR